MTDLRPVILAEIERRQWTRMKLAAEAGVSNRLLSYYFRGREIKSDNLLAILDTLGFRVVGPRRGRSQ